MLGKERRFGRGWPGMAGGLLLLMVVSPAIGQTEGNASLQQTANAERTWLAFQPPLDQPLRYVLGEGRGGMINGKAKLVQAESGVEFVFNSLNDAGYVVDFKHLGLVKDQDMSGLKFDFSSFERMLMQGITLQYQADRFGRPTALLNWEQVRPRLIEKARHSIRLVETLSNPRTKKATAKMQGQDGSGTALKLRQQLAALIATYERLSPQEATEKLLGDAALLFGIYPVNVVPNQPVPIGRDGKTEIIPASESGQGWRSLIGYDQDMKTAKITAEVRGDRVSYGRAMEFLADGSRAIDGQLKDAAGALAQDVRETMQASVRTSDGVPLLVERSVNADVEGVKFRATYVFRLAH